MRPIWKGALTFGLVNIPVGLDSAFRLLHAREHAPIAYRRVCTEENVEVPWGEIVKAQPGRAAKTPERRGAAAGRREAAARRPSTRRRAS